MATYIPSGLIESISGSVAGMNFTHQGRGGSVRIRGRKRRARSAKQLEMAARVGAIRNLWKTRSEGEIIGWKFIAQIWPRRNNIGQTVTATPFQLYYAHNMDRMILGSAPSNSLPLFMTSGFPGAIDLICTTLPAYVFSCDSYTTTFNYQVIVQMSRPVSSAPRNHWTNWAQVWVGDFNAGWTNMTTEVQETFGVLQLGERVAIRARFVGVGHLSSPWIQTTVTVSTA